MPRAMRDLQPRFPLYIPSKGRSAHSLTSRALTAMGVPHTVVVEPAEVDAYERTLSGSLATVIPLDLTYKARYETCDTLGQTKGVGAGAARNYIWAHALAAGHPWHWVMDDNIRGFYRLNHNLKVPCTSPAFWRAMEDFVLRYENVAMAGPNYFMFAKRKDKLPPFVTNTRIFSCNLIRNDLPFRWRGRYNEDAILSLDILKAGWCTVQYNAFLQEKMTTQHIPGGNTAEFYAAEGTAPKSAMLKAVHPDVTELSWKFGRAHHHCDYKRFKQTLCRKPDAEMTSPTADAMRLVQVTR